MKTDHLALSEFLNFGFVLGNRTLSLEHKLNEINVQYEIKNKKSNWKDVYNALEESTLKTCSRAKHPILMLSGGLDSRIIAGIITKHGLDIPALTMAYKGKESQIAKKVASVLEMQHYVIHVKPEEINMTQMKKIIKSTCGAIPIHWYLADSIALQKIRTVEISSPIFGTWLTELWNQPVTERDSVHEFCRKMAYPVRVLKTEYHRVAMKKFFEYCLEKPLKTLHYETLIKSYTRGLLVAFKEISMKPLLPSLHGKLLTETFALPISSRKNKTINYLILKHEFPELYRIRDVFLKLPQIIPLKIQLSYNRFHSFMIRRMNILRGDVDYLHAFKNDFELRKHLKKPLICDYPMVQDLVNEFFKTGKHFNFVTRLITYSIFHAMSREANGT